MEKAGRTLCLSGLVFCKQMKCDCDIVGLGTQFVAEKFMINRVARISNFILFQKFILRNRKFGEPEREFAVSVIEDDGIENKFESKLTN